MQAVPQPLSGTLVSLLLAAMCAMVGSATVVVAAFLRSLLCVTRGGGCVCHEIRSKRRQDHWKKNFTGPNVSAPGVR